jgi:mevalonate kinase
MLFAQAEHLIHGTPSGLDTAVSARGGLLKFRARVVQAEPVPKFPLHILLVDTGVNRDTRRMVQLAQDRLAGVGERAANALLDAMDQTALAALEALRDENGCTRLQVRSLYK